MERRHESQIREQKNHIIYIMKSEKEIEAILIEVENDERLYYKTAIVFSNAPLALIQCSLEVRSSLLRKILDKPTLNFYELRDKKNQP